MACERTGLTCVPSVQRKDARGEQRGDGFCQAFSCKGNCDTPSAHYGRSDHPPRAALEQPNYILRLGGSGFARFHSSKSPYNYQEVPSLRPLDAVVFSTCPACHTATPLCLHLAFCQLRLC